MEYNILGKTKLQVSEIGLGCWPIGGGFINHGLAGGWDNVNESEVKKAMVFAINKGVTVLDTADVYGFGKSERLLGWLLTEMKNKRDDLIVMSKVGYFQGCSIHPYDPLHMRHQLEMSLRNMNIDYIDIYFFHHLDFGVDNRYLPMAIETMHQFRKEGLIRFVGLRGPHKYSPRRNTLYCGKSDEFLHFIELAAIINPDVIGIRYNMLSQTYESEEKNIFGWSEKNNIGVVIYKPLAQGLLINKYDPNNPPVFSDKDHRSRKKWYGQRSLNILRSKIESLKREFNCKTSRDLVRLAMSYCITKYKNSCTLVGFKNTDHLSDSLFVDQRIGEKDREFIVSLFADVKNQIGEFY